MKTYLKRFVRAYDHDDNERKRVKMKVRCQRNGQHG